MAINKGDIADVLLTRGLAMTIGNPVLKVYQQGVNEPANAEKDYLALQYVPNDSSNLYVGTDAPSLHQGFLQVTVVGSSGKGTVRLHDLAGEVIEAWKKGTKLSGTGFRLKVPRQPTERGPTKDGKNYRIPVLIPYQVIAR